MTVRPDYITCIKSLDDEKISWCNRYVRTEFAFQSIDHAASTMRNESRLVTCSDCINAIFELFDRDEDAN